VVDIDGRSVKISRRRKSQNFFGGGYENRKSNIFLRGTMKPLPADRRHHDFLLIGGQLASRYQATHAPSASPGKSCGYDNATPDWQSPV